MTAPTAAPTSELGVRSDAMGARFTPRSARVALELPAELEASVPPEARGITRDAVRMMVAYGEPERIVHSNFSDIPRFLDPGDLVVVNTSGTLAAAVDGVAPDGAPVTVHLSSRLPAE